MMVLGESGSGGQPAASGSTDAGNSSGGGNVADNAGAGAAGTPPAGGTPASSGTASWRDTLPPELKDNAVLSNFTDVSSLAKSFVHAQSLIGKKGVFVPGEKSSEEDWKKFYTELGQPPLDKFEVKLPDGMKANETFLGKFKEISHKSGLLPKQAQGLMDWYVTEQQAQIAAQEQAAQVDIQTSLQELKKEWGEAYDGRLKQANAALDMAEKVPGLAGIKERLVENGLNQDPDVIKLVQWAASLMGEGKLIGDGAGRFGQTPAEMEAEIARHTSDLKSPLYDTRHADHTRVNELVADLRKKLWESKQSA